MQKALVFDMDECIGSFWSLWPLYELYQIGMIRDLDKLLSLTCKTVLPTCCRPNLDILLKFLTVLKKEKKIFQIFVYTNNGNYQTVKEKRTNKISFPNFIIQGIEKLYKTPGLFDLALETVFIRKEDAKKHIKNKFIDDLKIHGYTNKQILIFDDNVNVWKSGGSRVIKVSHFIGCSHYYNTSTNIQKLATNLFNMMNKAHREKYKNDNFIKKKIIDNILEEDKDERKPTNLKDNDIMTVFFQNITNFSLE